MKTNKSFTKRLKMTADGRALSRQGNKNHFRAKKTRVKQLAGKQLAEFPLPAQKLSRFISKKHR
ncbi:MAG: hypothetical protein WDZ85_00360 [Candidatus Paceibacterota bacterium]